ncbi:MAG TPA: hypothetical protein VF691_10580 [Cytophagaceae bacterium]|jgi:tetratricopeptide (TPR) repeat protein
MLSTPQSKSFVLFVVFSFLICYNSFTQKVSKDLEVANAYFEIGEYAKAREYYLISYGQSHSPTVAKNIAKCNYIIRDYLEAEVWFNKIYRSKDFTSLDLKDFCDVLKMNGKYNLAKTVAKNLIETNEYKELGEALVSSCDSALNWIQSDNEYKVSPLKKINTEYSEIAPTFYKDGIVFCTTREKNLIKKKTGFSDEPFYNLYFAWSDSNKVWRSGTFSIFLNTTDHEGPVTFNKNHDNIYLTRCRGGQSKLDSLKTNHLKLYKAYKQGIGWSKPEQFMINDSIYSFGHPSISDDEKIFFFASNMAGGYGGTDIYACFKIDSTKWSLPINLGPNINSEYNELFPFIHNEGKLYFSSDTPLGVGGYDIYHSAIVDGEWQTPVNMKFPINSSQDDYSYILDEKKSKGFLSSNRKGGKGKEDLYLIQLKEMK